MISLLQSIPIKMEIYFEALINYFINKWPILLNLCVYKFGLSSINRLFEHFMTWGAIKTSQIIKEVVCSLLKIAF